MICLAPLAVVAVRVRPVLTLPVRHAPRVWLWASREGLAAIGVPNREGAIHVGRQHTMIDVFCASSGEWQ